MLENKSNDEINLFLHKKKIFTFIKNPNTEIWFRNLKRKKSFKYEIPKELIIKWKKILEGNEEQILEQITEQTEEQIKKQKELIKKEKEFILKIKYLAPDLFV